MKRKSVIKMMVISIMTLFMAISVSAKSLPGQLDPNKMCRITIKTDFELAAKEEILVYKVGDIDYNIKSLTFKLTDEFTSTGVDLYANSNEDRSKNIEALKLKAKSLEPLQRITLKNDGSADIDVLPGVYLINQETEKRAIIQSSLVSIPNVNDELNDWDYEISIYPKVKAKEGRVTIKPGDTAQTGDTTVIWPYVGAAIGSMILLLYLIVMKKRKKNASSDQ